MGIRVKEQRKNGTVAAGEAVGDNDLSTADLADGKYEGRRVGKRRGNGHGDYERQPNGKQMRGGAVAIERARYLWPIASVSPKKLAEMEAVTLAIFERKVRDDRTYQEDESDPTRDFPTIAFRMLVDVESMHTLASVAVFLHTTPETMSVWQRNHPRMSQAVKMGKALQEHLMATEMAKGIMYPTSLIFTMKNLHKWADRIEQTHQFSLIDQITKQESEANPVDWEKPDLDLLRKGLPRASQDVIDMEPTTEQAEGKPDGG